jgi:type II secretory ATPase GspE/PulE/Tfp pilus assembly ATPase PilB-like protein
MRQDPDIIMVGEIRDTETAEIAVNSALTGHLVFSTLHTNSAAGTFPRLIDLGINPKVLSSSINIAMAQRLVRKLCPFCKKQIDTDESSQKIIDAILATVTDKTYLDGLDNKKIWQAAGCEKCNFLGYKGRIGVYEAIVMDEAIENVVKENPSEREINKASLPQNILSIAQDGVIKILQGVTTLSELSRVVDLEK